MLRRLARAGLHLADDLFAALSVGPRPQSGSLVAVLFHSLYRDRSQLADNALAPNQNVTAGGFRRFVDAVLQGGYTAVSPAQVARGLPPGGNYVMITFDDGYFNNTLALDVLEEFHVPATFFVSSEHVLRNHAFWWDVVSRELAKAGAPRGARNAEFKRIKALPGSQVERYLAARFGKASMKPLGDLDRPFTASELRDFSRHRWVHVGNHTCDHAILTNCSGQEAERQVRSCQQVLEQIIGYAPIAIAYPNGNYSPVAVQVSIAAGLKVGLTTLPRRNELPLAGDHDVMTLGRYLFDGGQDVHRQCRKFGSRFIPGNLLRTLIREPY